MKLFLISLINLAALQSRASIDCDIKTQVDKKITESKAVFKMKENEEGIPTYETVKDGYTFTVALVKTGYQLNIINMNSGERTVASYDEIAHDKTFMASLVNDKTKPARLAKLTCRTKI